MFPLRRSSFASPGYVVPASHDRCDDSTTTRCMRSLLETALSSGWYLSESARSLGLAACCSSSSSTGGSKPSARLVAAWAKPGLSMKAGGLCDTANA